ncbi:unnamed protein product [Brassica rapa subsp. narinosa]
MDKDKEPRAMPPPRTRKSQGKKKNRVVSGGSEVSVGSSKSYGLVRYRFRTMGQTWIGSWSTPLLLSLPGFLLCFGKIGETPPGEHVPLWLPAFPDLHTYHETPIGSKRD